MLLICPILLFEIHLEPKTSNTGYLEIQEQIHEANTEFTAALAELDVPVHFVRYGVFDFVPTTTCAYYYNGTKYTIEKSAKIGATISLIKRPLSEFTDPAVCDNGLCIQIGPKLLDHPQAYAQVDRRKHELRIYYNASLDAPLVAMRQAVRIVPDAATIKDPDVLERFLEQSRYNLAHYVLDMNVLETAMETFELVVLLEPSFANFFYKLDIDGKRAGRRRDSIIKELTEVYNNRVQFVVPRIPLLERLLNPQQRPRFHVCRAGQLLYTFECVVGRSIKAQLADGIEAVLDGRVRPSLALQNGRIPMPPGHTECIILKGLVSGLFSIATLSIMALVNYRACINKACNFMQRKKPRTVRPVEKDNSQPIINHGIQLNSSNLGQQSLLQQRNERYSDISLQNVTGIEKRRMSPQPPSTLKATTETPRKLFNSGQGKVFPTQQQQSYPNNHKNGGLYPELLMSGNANQNPSGIQDTNATPQLYNSRSGSDSDYHLRLRQVGFPTEKKNKQSNMDCYSTPYVTNNKSIHLLCAYNDELQPMRETNSIGTIKEIETLDSRSQPEYDLITSSDQTILKNNLQEISIITESSTSTTPIHKRYDSRSPWAEEASSRLKMSLAVDE